jgi:hypothetical protein
MDEHALGVAVGGQGPSLRPEKLTYPGWISVVSHRRQPCGDIVDSRGNIGLEEHIGWRRGQLWGRAPPSAPSVYNNSTKGLASRKLRPKRASPAMARNGAGVGVAVKRAVVKEKK